MTTLNQVNKADVGDDSPAKAFKSQIKTLTQAFNALIALSLQLGLAGKGSYLAFDMVGGLVAHFNRRDLRSATAKFTHDLNKLTVLMKTAKKKSRSPVVPESLSGTYTPVYAGAALQEFLRNPASDFGSLNPQSDYDPTTGQINVSQKLIDQLPLAREQGLLLRNSATMLFFIFAHSNNLQDPDNAQYVRSNDVMDVAFGGNIPATYYTYKDPKNNKFVKIGMGQAVANGIVPRQLTTYEVVRNAYPDFNPQSHKAFYYQNIAALNYTSSAALAADPAFAEINELIQNEDTRRQMLLEHNIIKATSEQWKQLLEPGRKKQREDRKKENKK